jgi:6-phosphogluconolactonase
VAAVTIAENDDATARQAAERITALVEQAIAARGRACVCLTGGSTPERLYELLADPGEPWRSRIEWSRVHLWWGDERHVPPDDPASNYGMAARALVSRVPIPATQVHRMRGEVADAADAAREYDRLLPDVFDVMLLGLGPDAHIASIFPYSPLLPSSTGTGTHAITREGPRTAAVWAPHLNAWRITLTPAEILNARAIVMLVAGPAKADAVHAALRGGSEVQRYPAALLRLADDRVEWFLDAAASAKIKGQSSK